MSAERAAKLAEQLRARRAWYERLAELAREQVVLIGGDGEGLAELVERKRAVMAELERLAAGAPGLREEWEAIRPGLSPAQSAPVEAELAAVSKVLEQVVKSEEEARRLAEGERASVSSEMKATNEARRAAAAYGKPSNPAGPRFVDRSE
ncbi:MAG: flagellar protein FlgN [Planctomycetes bacterium]|nr:flagellar protein FlgN [Planctomycetota bacterium]